MKHLKLLSIFLLFTIFQVRAQEVTLYLQNVTVKEAIEALKEQTKKSLFFEVGDIDLNKKISIDLNNKSIEEALNQILQGQSLSYDIKGNYIVVGKALVDNGMAGLRITGSVVDVYNEALPGVTLVVPGTQAGTITDENGKFTLNVPGDTKKIKVSYIGFVTQDVSVPADNRPLNIILQENTQHLDEVVIVGYGTQKKENLTGAVSVVSGRELAGRSAANVSQLLQGTVPNMNVTFSSGRPGEGGSFNIRGINSISSSAAPLVMIDGVEGDINRVNPNDIESVTVLKDASAAAVYGARASYGVILVTTRSGVKDKASVSYNGRYSFGKPTVSTDFETRGYYSAGINDMFFSTYQGSNYTTYNEKDYYEMWIRRNDKTEHPDRPWVVEENGQYKYYANTNWYDYLFNMSRPTWEHNLSISGGSDKIRYMLSGNYYNQEGIIRINPDRFKKYNFRTKISAEVTSWLEISNNTSYFHSSYFYPGNAGVSNLFTRSTNHALASFVPVNPDGTPVFLTTNNNGYEVADGASAILTHNGHRNEDKIYEFATTFEAVIKPVRNFEVRANYSFTHYNRQDMNRSVDVPYSKEPGIIITMPESRTGGSKLYESQINHWYQAYNIYGTYENSFLNSHNVKVTAGVNSENKRFKDLKMDRNGMLSDALDDFNLAKGDIINLTGGKNKYSLLGVFYRVNYDYQGKYLLEASGRYDGSSRFRRGDRYGFFPSFSGGWRISEENFFAAAKDWVNNLKVRLSYGSLGNQQVGYYDYIQQISTGSTLGYSFGDGSRAPYATETAPNAANLTWETVVTKNIGLDIGLLNNRLTIVPDFYIRDTKDMLMPGKALPGVYGANSPRVNGADLRTRGWEVSVSWNDKFTLLEKPFNYGITAGVGDNTTKVTKYDNPTKRLGTFYEGQKLGEIWGYVVDGYFKTDEEAANYHIDQSYVNEIINVSYKDRGLHAGDLKFVDLDGDNVITPTTMATDIKDQKVIGNSLPRYAYSANLNASWNGIDFSVFFQGIGKQNWYPGSEAMGFWGPYARPYASFIPKDFLSKVWSEDNPDAYFPRPRGYIALSGTRRSLGVANTKYLQDLAYCRLKNLTIGYTLPGNWLSRLKVEKLRIYFSGENLFTFTKLESDYIDPEQAASKNTYSSGSSDGRAYPWSKTFSFGVDLTF